MPTTCSVLRLYCSMQNELRMNEEMEKILIKGDGDLIEVLFLNFVVGTEENKFKPSLVLVWLLMDEVVRVQFLHSRTLRFWLYNNHSAIYLHSSTIRSLYIRLFDTTRPRNWIHINRTIKLNTASID